MNALIASAGTVTGSAFFVVLLALSFVEWSYPRRNIEDSVSARWLGNLPITFLNSYIVGLISRALLPAVGVAWAVWCRERGWGLFNQGLPIPAALEVMVSIALLDLTGYLQHSAFHRFGLLWRIHCTHHSDSACDVTTGVRFHPLDVVASSLISVAGVAALGASPLAVLIGNLLAELNTLVVHANIKVPASVDRVVRRVFVTPAMHQVHHSQDFADSNSNLATIFSFWDRLFGTYREQPVGGLDGMSYGLREFSDKKYLTLWWMLLMPFLREPRP